jgi:Tol biopolymer transport system component
MLFSSPMQSPTPFWVAADVRRLKLHLYGPSGRCLSTLALILAAAFLASGFDATGADARTGQIIFSSNRSGAWRLWEIKADGSGLKQLTRQETDDQDVDPVLSPDGKSVLFTSTRGGKSGIWRMPRDGAKPERICDGDQAEWAPDGASIALRRNERVLSRELASGNEKFLSPADWPHCACPAWSPDGKSLAFAARWEAGNAIYLVPAEGGKPAKVYDKQGACEPHWSPDGTRLVYETETHICTVNPDGTKNRLVTFFGGVQRYARFSPDGKWLVFCQGVSEQGPWELYLIPAAGGAPQRLTEGGSDMYPDWR